MYSRCSSVSLDGSFPRAGLWRAAGSVWIRVPHRHGASCPAPSEVDESRARARKAVRLPRAGSWASGMRRARPVPAPLQNGMEWNERCCLRLRATQISSVGICVAHQGEPKVNAGEQFCGRPRHSTSPLVGEVVCTTSFLARAVLAELSELFSAAQLVGAALCRPAFNEQCGEGYSSVRRAPPRP